MSLVWNDATAYSQGTRGVKAPRTWSTGIDNVDLTVTKYIGHGDEWVFHSYLLGLKTIPLGTTDLVEAKKRALHEVKNALTSRISAYEKVVQQLNEEV